MSDGVSAPRKRTQPTKPRAPSKKKVVSQTRVEEAPPTIIEDTVVWEKELDDLFRTLREPQDEGVSSTQKDPPCPLHTHVSLKKKVSKRGWEYVRCSGKNCPIWLPWDRHLNYVLSEVQNKMHPVLRQGFFYCFCREPCKGGLTKRTQSPNGGRCFLTLLKKIHNVKGVIFFSGSTRCGVPAIPIYKCACPKVNKVGVFKNAMCAFLCISLDDGFDAGDDRSCSCVTISATMCTRSTTLRYQVSVPTTSGVPCRRRRVS